MGLVSLVIAGEAIFSLPFHIMRFFRPTVLEVFQISNTQIGQVQATYGVIAMLSYFLGGPLADRFEAKNLLALSLAITAVGGMYYATIPDLQGLTFLFAFWGGSTILLFWGALIKATRAWGGDHKQGSAFGLLEAGRGLFAAVLVSIAIGILSFSTPVDLETLSAAGRTQALQHIIYLYIGGTLLAALCVIAFVPYSQGHNQNTSGSLQLGTRLKTVFKNKLIWPQMLVVVSAYVAYKGVDNYVLYAVQGYGLSEVAGAKIGALTGWTRPIAAIIAGYIANRFRASRVIAVCFLMLMAGYSVFALMTPNSNLYHVLLVNVVFTSLAVYALHAIYFALLAESNMPLNVTGTAVGVVSVIGFTPDIFVAPAMGWMLDNHATVEGHQLVFASLGAFSIIGFIAALIFIRYNAVVSGHNKPTVLTR